MSAGTPFPVGPFIPEMEAQRPAWELAVADYIMSLKAAGRSQYTIKHRQEFYDRLTLWAVASGFQPTIFMPTERIVSFLADEAARGLQRSTLALYFGEIRSLFAHFVRRGWIVRSPCASIQPPRFRRKPVQPVSMATITAILAAAHQPARTYLLLLLGSGMRSCELCNLRREDIDFERGTIRLHGKGDKERYVAPGRAALAALREVVNGQDGCVFHGQRGGCLTPNALRHCLRAAGKKVGARLSPHRLRHTFAAEFLRAGGNLFLLQDILGHADLSTTRIYDSWARAERALEAQRELNPADRL